MIPIKHYGDITKIHGNEVEAVDVITGGSPCQDLSVAGKRAGLAGERSGLFMEQIRIIKEMRNETGQLRMRRADEHIRPRFMVWENVYGAFSSNKGDDFRCVLESHPQDSRVKMTGDVNQTISSNMAHDAANGGLVMVIENHPNDSRCKFSSDGMVQTLSGRMGTGGATIHLW